MARPLRLNLPGGFYHVTSRGNERKEIFAGEEELEKYVCGTQTGRAGNVCGWVGLLECGLSLTPFGKKNKEI